MSNYICKDCNYTSDKGGLCPYCSMPMESIDALDDVTGESRYEEEEVAKVEKETDHDLEYEPLDVDKEEEDDEDDE